MCYCGNTGDGMDTKIRVGTESWPWREKKFPCCSCPELEPITFQSWVWHSTAEPSLLPTQESAIKRERERRKKKSNESQILNREKVYFLHKELIDQSQMGGKRNWQIKRELITTQQTSHEHSNTGLNHLIWNMLTCKVKSSDTHLSNHHSSFKTKYSK